MTNWQEFARTVLHGDGYAIHMMLPPHLRDAASPPPAWQELDGRGTE